MSSCYQHYEETLCERGGGGGVAQSLLAWSVYIQTVHIPEEKLEQVPHHLDNDRVNQGERVLDAL